MLARRSQEVVGGCGWREINLRWMVVGSVGKTRRRPGGLAAGLGGIPRKGVAAAGEGMDGTRLLESRVRQYI